MRAEVLKFQLASRQNAAGEQIGAPGKFPFTRGVHETMYRGKPWTMRMFAGFGTPEDTNKRFHFLLGSMVYTMAMPRRIESVGAPSSHQ